TMLSRALGAAHEVLLFRMAIQHFAQSLRGPIHRGCQRSISGAREGSDEIFAQAIGPQRGQTHLASIISELVHDIDNARVIAYRSADETNAFRVLWNRF